MYIPLILFFSSLAAIVFIIQRKLAAIDHEQILNHEEVLFDVPFLKEVKKVTVVNVKRHGYKGLVATMRFYMLSKSFLHNKYKEIRTNIKNRIKATHINGERKEISKFLKVIGDYKRRIREIKHKIKKEENL